MHTDITSLGNGMFWMTYIAELNFSDRKKIISVRKNGTGLQEISGRVMLIEIIGLDWQESWPNLVGE